MGALLFTWDSVPILNSNYQQPRRIINMMKVALVLLVATVLISRSAGNPLREARQNNPFGNQQFNGGVGTVNQCATTGACHSGQGGNANRPAPAVQGSNTFNGNVDQVHQCATTGSCHGQGKKKRSVIPQLNTEAFRQSRQFEDQTFNGPVGEINGAFPLPGFEGQTFNGPVGVVNGADQPSEDIFQFPQSLQCNCPDQSRPGSWICIKDEPQCQCQCKPFAVYEPSVMTNMISSSPRQKRQFQGQQFNGPVGEITSSNPGPAFEGQTFNGPVGEINGSNPGPVGVVGGSDQVASQVTTGITSTNPNTNPTGIAPIDFVNDLGIRYKGNYFNMHLNTL